ncbi:MAG TPA: hypothetical protein EYH32_04965 [Anaerolineae bacterium]|nr:hypothetical protein [Anaerolineae bacterium]
MNNLPANVDLDVLRDRYIPADGERVDEEEFVQRGIELVSTARYAFVLLGELIDWKFRHEGADTDESRRQIVRRYAPLWGVSEASIWKAWVVACRWPELPRPQDAPPTLAYEIISGCSTPEEADEVMDRALAEGWSVADVRDIKRLRAMGVLDEWTRLRLVSDGSTIYVVDGGQRRVPVARLVGGDGLARAGAALLRIRARV